MTNLLDIQPVDIKGSRFYPVGDALYPSITSVISTDIEAQERMTFFWEDRILRTILGEHFKLPEGAVAFNTMHKTSFKDDHKELISSFRDEVQARKFLEQKYTAERGERLHTLIENYLLSKTVPEEIGIESVLFDLMRPDLDKINKIRALEQVMISDSLQIAGRVDCIAEFDSVLSVIDFKTSTKLKRKEDRAKWWIQVCFYAVAYEEMTGIPIKQLVIINGREDGKCSTFIEQVDDWYGELMKAIANYRDLQIQNEEIPA